jgi:alkylhydroperoxidase family enzyme
MSSRPTIPADAGNGPANLSGTWEVTFHHPAGDQRLRLLLEILHGAVTGSVSNPSLGVAVPIVSGGVTGNRFSFLAPMTSPVHVEIRYEGAVAGDAIWGEISIAGAGSFLFDGRRE